MPEVAVAQSSERCSTTPLHRSATERQHFRMQTAVALPVLLCTCRSGHRQVVATWSPQGCGSWCVTYVCVRVSVLRYLASNEAPRVLDATSSDRLRTAITAPQVWQQLSPEDRRRVQSMLAAAGADGWYLDWYGRLVRSVRGTRRVTCFVLCGDAGVGIA